MLVPMLAAAEHITFKPPASADAPGPLSFADGARVRRILSGAGFTGIQLEEVDDTLTVAGATTLDAAVELILQIGPTAAALREADPAIQPRVAAAVRAAITPYQTDEGVRMGCGARIVTARNA